MQITVFVCDMTGLFCNQDSNRCVYCPIIGKEKAWRNPLFFVSFW